MTKQEFESYRFSSLTKVKVTNDSRDDYGKVYPVVEIDFRGGFFTATDDDGFHEYLSYASVKPVEQL
jgi:hypothetical protein